LLWRLCTYAMNIACELSLISLVRVYLGLTTIRQVVYALKQAMNTREMLQQSCCCSSCKRLLPKTSRNAHSVWSRDMLASTSTTQRAMAASQRCAQSMPFSQNSMPAMCTMYMAAASTFIIGTGALASVSLFVVVPFVVSLLLVSLVVVISILLLTCLTRPISLAGLVGQTQETVWLATCTRTTRED